MAASDTPAKGEGVKSAQRALSIIELLARTEPSLTFAEIGDVTGFPRSSLFGLLKTMVDMRWLELDEQTRKYRLGIRTLEAGNAYLRSIDLVALVRPQMDRICAATDETVQLAVLDDRYNVYIAKVEGTGHLRLASEVGRRLEAHATALGKMLLAGLSETELDRLLGNVKLERFTPATITDFALLKQELAASAERGYATDNEDHTRGVRCFAVPIRNHSGKTIAALSVSFPTVRFTERRGEKARVLLVEGAQAVERELGYRAGQSG
ncbi:IclR family transcriptional regulator [soil metagenome]